MCLNSIRPFLGRLHSRLEHAHDLCRMLVRPSASVDPWLDAAHNKHQGERCFIIATGPSLNLLDLSQLKGEICFGVNGAYMLENVDLTYFTYVSNWWYKQHINGIQNVRCERRFIPSEYQSELDSSIPTTWYNKISPKPYSRYKYPMPIPAGFSKNPNRYLYAGGSVVFICLQLAYYMGFQEVIVIGLDHSYSKEKDASFRQHTGSLMEIEDPSKTHFTADYVKKGTQSHIDLQAMERGYLMALKHFKQSGKSILNASAKTQLDIFPLADFNRLF